MCVRFKTYNLWRQSMVIRSTTTAIKRADNASESRHLPASKRSGFARPFHPPALLFLQIVTDCLVRVSSLLDTSAWLWP